MKTERLKCEETLFFYNNKIKYTKKKKEKEALEEILLLHIVTYLKMQEDRDGNKKRNKNKQGKIRLCYFLYAFILVAKIERNISYV